MDEGFYYVQTHNQNIIKQLLRELVRERWADKLESEINTLISNIVKDKERIDDAIVSKLVLKLYPQENYSLTMRLQELQNIKRDALAQQFGSQQLVRKLSRE